MNRMLYHAVRNIFVLKELPTEKTCPITRYMCDYCKSTGVYLPSSYIEACSILFADSAKSEDTAKEYVKSILNWTQDKRNIARSLESAVGNYNTVATFFEAHGALLAAAPMKTLGSDIIFTFFEKKGAVMNQYTSTTFKDKTPEERQAFSFFHAYIRRIDMQFIEGDPNRNNSEFDEYNEPTLVVKAVQLCGRTVVIGPTNPCLRLVKLQMADYSPILFRMPTIVIGAVTAAGSSANVMNAVQHTVTEDDTSGVTAQDLTSTRKTSDVKNVGATSETTRAAPPLNSNADQNAQELGKGSSS